MQKQFLTLRQCICMIALFMFGSTLIISGNTPAEHDSWLSSVLVMVFAFPFYLIYARIMRLFPEMGFYDILEKVFGKVLGKILVLFMTWYALHLGALVLRNFSEFIKVVSMPETPELPLMILMLLVTIYIAKSNIKTFGKWAVIVLPIVLFIILLTVAIGLKNMELDNLQPIGEHGLGTISVGAYHLLTFPFLEVVLFLTLAGSVKKTVNPYKIFLTALSITGCFLIIVVLRNLTLLGPAMVGSDYFPSYMTARILSVGDFLSRFEGSISLNFVLGGITKITLCLIAASKGFSALFGFKEEKPIVFSVAMLMLALCAVVYSNIMDMFSFLEVYQFYAIPFQMAIPIAVWLTGEYKVRNDKKNQAGAETAEPPPDEDENEFNASGGALQGQ